MSDLTQAFDIPINTENQLFVSYPYIPITPSQENLEKMTIARYIDLKNGTKFDDPKTNTTDW